jgi:hypothetical protein
MARSRASFAVAALVALGLTRAAAFAGTSLPKPKAAAPAIALSKIDVAASTTQIAVVGHATALEGLSLTARLTLARQHVLVEEQRVRIGAPDASGTSEVRCDFETLEGKRFPPGAYVVELRFELNRQDRFDLRMMAPKQRRLLFRGPVQFISVQKRVEIGTEAEQRAQTDRIRARFRALARELTDLRAEIARAKDLDDALRERLHRAHGEIDSAAVGFAISPSSEADAKALSLLTELERDVAPTEEELATARDALLASVGLPRDAWLAKSD